MEPSSALATVAARLARRVDHLSMARTTLMRVSQTTTEETLDTYQPVVAPAALYMLH
jgi:hypothetical protein